MASSLRVVTSFQQKFTDANDYAILVWGQSNSRPWGDRDSEGYSEAFHLRRSMPGLDVTVTQCIQIGGGTHGAPGTQSLLFVAETLVSKEWNGAEFRLYRTEHTIETPKYTRTIATASATCALNGNGHLVVTQAGAGFATFLSVGDQVLVGGWTIASGDNINRTHVVTAVGADSVTLRPCRTTYSAVDATSTANSAVLLRTVVTFGVGTVVETTANNLLVTWTVQADVTNILAGHVHTRRSDGTSYWKDYENIRVLLPYQPEVPGGFPAGTPVVAGFTVPPEVDSYSKLGLFVPFTWEEGIEGVGATGTVSAAPTTNGMADSTAAWITNFFAGGWVTCGGSWARVNSNTTTALVLDAWRGGTPSNGATYTVWAPHWRDNPYAASPGEGFRRPTNDPQPAPWSAQGWNYNRPANRRTMAHGGVLREAHPVDATINAGLVARVKGAGMTATKVGGSNGDPTRLRIARTDTGNTPSTEAIQFEWIVRNGDTTALTGWTINSGLDINGLWTVRAFEPVSGADGSYVDLEPAAGQSLAAAVNATAVSTSAVTRMVYRRVQRFGAMVELAWRISTMLGRRIHVIHLSCNSAAQHLRQTANYFGFQGQIGWWDWRKHMDWTPGNPDGMATRLESMLRDMASNALAMEGNTKPLKVIGIFGFQGEGDAMTKVGRETYAISIRTFYDWLRRVLSEAGLAPSSGTIPIVHPIITTVPYCQPVVPVSPQIYPGGGDTGFAINAGINALAAEASYFFATFDPNGHPKMENSVFGTDPMHFNGVGEAKNGAVAASKWAEIVGAAL